MHKPQSKTALRGFIGDKFKLWLPDKSFTPGHSTPFDFVADAFFNPGLDLAAWANRSGLKTLCASAIAALEYRFTEGPLMARVLAGSEDQAKNLYRYWAQWCFGMLSDRVKGEPQRLKTYLDNGEFEILAASQKRVRGAKVHKLYRDEIDEIDPEIYGASVGMLASMGGIPARTIDTSTWHRAGGPMGKLVEEADERGIKLHKWNVWESIQNCPQERHDNGRNCEACALGEVCLEAGRHYRPGSKVGLAAACCGLFAVDDAIKQLSQWSKQQWEAEAECKRPTLEGTVYPQFDRHVHVLPDLNFNDDLPTYRAIDFGLNNFVCLWVQEDKRGNVYIIDEYWSQQTKLTDNAREILKIERQQAGGGEPVGIHDTYVDPAGRNRNDQTGYSDIDVLKGEGIPCSYTMNSWAREVVNGIQLVRAALQPGAGPARLFLAKTCTQTIKAFENYALRKVNGIWVDQPQDPQEWEHPMDAVRYFFVNRCNHSRWTDSQWSATGG